MDTKQLLLDFSAMDGVAGRENDVADYGAKLLAPYGEVTITALGSVLCTVKQPTEGGDHVLLDAHMDEIGLVVTFIDESGFLRVAPAGGIDRRLLAAAPVVIHTQDGAIPGVVCSTPPHLSTGEAKNPKVEDIWIDTGFSAEEAKQKIFPGDIVTLKSSPRELGNGLISGKATDDRAGCVSLLKALEYLGNAKLNCGLSVVFSTMEEVGCIGAKTAAYQANPTHAIAVDVSFAYTPDAKKEKTGELRKGPMIGIAPILSRAMSDGMIEVAKANEIPFQREVMGGKTGTNADVIATSRGGVAAALLSIPQKYMHTPIETVAVEDVENTGRLIAAYLIANWGGNR
jgi:endoglucanase